MELQPLSIEKILTWLQQAHDHKSSLVVEARIAVSPAPMQLLDVQPAVPLAVIRY